MTNAVWFYHLNLLGSARQKEDLSWSLNQIAEDSPTNSFKIAEITSPTTIKNKIEMTRRDNYKKRVTIIDKIVIESIL